MKDTVREKRLRCASGAARGFRLPAHNVGIEVLCSLGVCGSELVPDKVPFSCFDGRGHFLLCCCAHGLVLSRRYAFAARSSSAISSFFIFSIACIAADFLIRSGKRAGTICQQRPNLSEEFLRGRFPDYRGPPGLSSQKEIHA